MTPLRVDLSVWVRGIDERASRLYSLTPDEIQIVEAPTSHPCGNGGAQSHDDESGASIGEVDE